MPMQLVYMTIFFREGSAIVVYRQLMTDISNEEYLGL